jgi:hypothetical protein
MATDDRPGTKAITEAPGLAGGPGPTPPGVEDGTPRPLEGDVEEAGAIPLDAQEQQEAGEAAERSAGTRQADVRRAGGEGGGGAREERERRAEGERSAEEDARREAWDRAARRDPEEPDPS